MIAVNRISVFEHESVLVGKSYEGHIFTASELKLCHQFHGQEGTEFFSLINNGIKFNHHVGVLQVGSLAIEILPKIDKYQNGEEWRKRLLEMLFAVGELKVKNPSSSSLSLKSNFLLDAYISLFISEVEFLMHKGLIKKYFKEEGNLLKLKGRLILSKQLQNNATNAHKFYTAYSDYGFNHIILKIINETIVVLKQININNNLKGRLNYICLHFPELPKFNVDEITFKKLCFDRKSEEYRFVLQLSKFILMNFHPEVKGGKERTLTIMFNMNELWEKFIFVSLVKHMPKGYSIHGQQSKLFWESEQQTKVSLKPDIYIKGKGSDNYVFDTKWKNVDLKPSVEDLRQMYVYGHYFGANKMALIYPGQSSRILGRYDVLEENKLGMECCLLKIPIGNTIRQWQKNIADEVFENWLNLSNRERALL